MEALYSLSSPSTCPSVYRSDNGSIINVILEHYNYTGRLKPGHLQSSSGISLTKVIFLLISICIILENLVVLLAVLFRIRLRSRWVYICIANTTLSDLLAGVAYVVNLCMSGSRTMELSPALWLLREGLLFVALAASIFSLLLIAVERYSTMLKPLSQKSAKKTFRIYSMVALCWLLACVLGLLPLLGWNCVCNLDGCSTLLPLYSKSYILFALILFFFILLAIAVLYGAIFLHVRKSTEAVPMRGRGRSMRLLKTVITIVGVFSLCWGPLFLLLLVDFFCGSRDCRFLSSSDWVIAMAVLNSALNPIIYALGSADLRRAIAHILCGFCLCTGLIDPKTFLSKETGSTSGSRHDSLRNSFSQVRKLSTTSLSKVRNLSATSPTPKTKQGRKKRLSTNTSCLSVSSG